MLTDLHVKGQSFFLRSVLTDLHVKGPSLILNQPTVYRFTKEKGSKLFFYSLDFFSFMIKPMLLIYNKTCHDIKTQRQSQVSMFNNKFTYEKH